MPEYRVLRIDEQLYGCEELPAGQPVLCDVTLTDAAGAAVMDTIRTTGNLDKDTEEQLKTALTRYTESFVKAH